MYNLQQNNVQHYNYTMYEYTYTHQKINCYTAMVYELNDNCPHNIYTD